MRRSSPQRRGRLLQEPRGDLPMQAAQVVLTTGPRSSITVAGQSQARMDKCRRSAPGVSRTSEQCEQALCMLLRCANRDDAAAGLPAWQTRTSRRRSAPRLGCRASAHLYSAVGVATMEGGRGSARWLAALCCRASMPSKVAHVHLSTRFCATQLRRIACPLIAQLALSRVTHSSWPSGPLERCGSLGGSPY